ncbi:UdgX family uracil-DNA binding protein [Goodfellowiella coeruleoviolacea]|uniref:Type-4 uracil-DNA glycosylase n=1 Tax=Goodfellowiella coeruleoviolacea TaxID=334858 RepID=A0AAE3GA75_9PSEU|nr:UdgX family uracil-DNA binding protein [Goodfellowiella coeruleoviolacea]MCP2163725.1 DNA polymerase [Goodfellowiella coeruleoviolacea]
MSAHSGTATRTAAGAEPYVPEHADLAELRAAVQACRGCPLYQGSTQAVFGAGPADARVLLVGEQPGDQEDRRGQPFVGPAGRLLDRALAEAGIDRAEVYLTNAVKHFKFERAERGKRRIHKRPSRGEVLACQPWLLAELREIRPELVVCLGATAAQAVLGSSFRVTQHRGELVALPQRLRWADADDTAPTPRVTATVHPSSVLRDPDRDDAYQAFRADLRAVAAALRPRRRP